ncbi:hypothetical protein SISSUDRAFT_729336 [Sistotremastrum suecicum HHB10207 ss-3]|uniref:Uncharacterized protein n=1 Tax=Sistotremastrum suecicum HHB10207 ss-3 TaxID=1314776 RepID=A0A166DI03_9AGAM|nr:hypothetical protein SISSUDRAFT_729336 [Sistotremastrum suecicum HHB10207 ss-3]
MFSKLAVAFIAALASSTIVNAQGGIVEVGTLTEFDPEFFTCESAAGTGPNVIAVSPALLQEFTCGHTVRVICKFFLYDLYEDCSNVFTYSRYWRIGSDHSCGHWGSGHELDGRKHLRNARNIQRSWTHPSWPLFHYLGSLKSLFREIVKV